MFALLYVTGISLFVIECADIIRINRRDNGTAVLHCGPPSEVTNHSILSWEKFSKHRHTCRDECDVPVGVRTDKHSAKIEPQFADRFSIDKSDGSLTLTRVSSADEGQYRCIDVGTGLHITIYQLTIYGNVATPFGSVGTRISNTPLPTTEAQIGFNSSKRRQSAWHAITSYSPIPDTWNKLHSETQYFKYTMVGIAVVLLLIGVTALLRTTKICAGENGDILQLRNLLNRRPIDYSEIHFPTSAPVAPYSNLLSEATVANNQRQQCVNREPANTHWTPLIAAHPASENFNNDGLPIENKSCQDNGEVITESVVSNSISCLLPTASSKQCQNSVLKSKTPSSVSSDTFIFSLDQNSETNENSKFYLPSCPKQPEFEVSLSKCIIEAKVECTPESSLTCDQPTGSMCSLKLHNFPDVKQEIPSCQGYSEMGARRKDDSQSAREQLSSDSSGTYGARMGAMFTKRASEDSCDRVSSSSSSSDSVYVPPVKCIFLRPKHGKLQQGKRSTENKQPSIDSNTNDSNSIAPIGLPCQKVIPAKTSSNKYLSKTCEKNPESVEIKDHKDHVKGAFSQRGDNPLAPIFGRLRCVVPNQILCGTNDPLSNDGRHSIEKSLAKLKSFPDEDSDSPGHSYEEVPENDYEHVE